LPDTYYLPGQVLPGDDLVSATHLGATLRMRVANVRRITALQLPLVLVEIGLVLEDARGNRMWLRETDPQFHWLARRLDIATRLGANWHHRVEAGERLTAEIQVQAAAPKPAK
jgi:hypothetical protein